MQASRYLVVIEMNKAISSNGKKCLQLHLLRFTGVRIFMEFLKPLEVSEIKWSVKRSLSRGKQCTFRVSVLSLCTRPHCCSCFSCITWYSRSRPCLWHTNKHSLAQHEPLYKFQYALDCIRQLFQSWHFVGRVNAMKVHLGMSVVYKLCTHWYVL